MPHSVQGWRSVTLGDITVDSAFGPRFSADLYDENGTVGTIRTTDINAEGIINYKTIPYANLPVSFSNHFLKNGDLLITRSGTCGVPCVFEEQEKPIIAGAFLIRFVLKQDVDRRFLHALLKSDFVQKEIENMASGGVQKNLSGTNLKKLEIVLPPPQEQQKIAQILSTWDKAIEKQEALIAAKQKRKKALMQQLLTGKKRFAGFDGEWKEVKLGDIFSKITNGLTYDTDAVAGLPVTRIETISTGKINYDKVGWAPTEENTMRFALQCGDILYSHINSLEHIGRVAIYCAEQPLYHGMNLLLLRANEKVLPEFIFHILNSRIGKKYAKSYAKSAVNQASISTTDVKSFKVKIPPLPEQQKITSVFSSADQEIETHQKHLSALKEQKKGLMQQLLTGRKRVKVNSHV